MGGIELNTIIQLDQINAVINSKLSRSLITVSTISVHSEYLTRTSKYALTTSKEHLKMERVRPSEPSELHPSFTKLYHPAT